jgi:hypothetical protein
VTPHTPSPFLAGPAHEALRARRPDLDRIRGLSPGLGAGAPIEAGSGSADGSGVFPLLDSSVSDESKRESDCSSPSMGPRARQAVRFSVVGIPTSVFRLAKSRLPLRLARSRRVASRLDREIAALSPSAIPGFLPG